MNRQKEYKDKMINNIKMDYINIMKVEEFFKMIEKENDDKSFYRYINISYNNKGAKIPTGEKNDLSIEEIKNNRGNPQYNTLSLAVKHIPDLYVVDYDEEEIDCEFYDLLNSDNVAYTNTKKGTHYYIKIKNIGEYTNQQKIHVDGITEVDLIKKNNIWETRDRDVIGNIKEYDWNDIKKYFNIKKMNFKNSPPVSPTTSDEELKEEEEERFKIEKIYNSNELKDIIDLCKIQDECYEYFEWLKIGMALHNITDGDNIGLGLFKDFTTQYEGFKNKTTKRDVDYKWKSFNKEKDGNKLGLSFLRKLKEKYQPINCKSLKSIYETSYEKTKNKTISKNAVLKEMNNRLIFVKETGDFIILDKKIIRKENEELITMPCWYLKTTNKARDHFSDEIDIINIKNEDGKIEEIKFNPFKWWCEWIDRRKVRAIGFDPRDNVNKDLFNLWNGFNISKEIADGYDERDAEPILNVIKDIWCKGDENSFEYVLNYLSHIIQKPHIKTGVLLALKSKQGGMKGIILNKLAQIIGDTHYAQNSNANFLFGDFNGQLEGKILINLDEAFWGGDKKLEGVIKNKITETRQTINKKNKENYMVDCYANYIITTNNDWFAGTTEDDRRHYCLELDNRMAGRMTPEKMAYIQPVLDAPCEAFAKVLYNRDISDFIPRQFKKTKLLQEQVERNWNSPKVWYNNVMKDGGFEYEGHFVEWNKTLIVQGDYGNINKYGLEIKNKKNEKKVVYEKDWLFKCYDKQTYDGRKFMNSAFWREILKNCMGDLYVETRIQVQKERKIFIFLPTLEEARKKWNEMQEFEYDYGGEEEDEWVIDSDSDCEIDNDTEDE